MGKVSDAQRAVEGGTDYVGIGAVWDTSSKDLKGKKALGPDGVGEILDTLAGTNVDAVAIGEHAFSIPLTIGGIHLPNLPQLLHASISPKGKALAGIAVISDIVGSQTPKAAANELKVVLDSFHQSRQTPSAGLFRTKEGLSVNDMLDEVGNLIQVTRRETPLVNQVSYPLVQISRRSPTTSSSMTLPMRPSPWVLHPSWQPTPTTS